MNEMMERKKIVAYYPDWEDYQEEKLQYEKLTHIIYAFAIPTADGGILKLNHPERAKKLIENAHKHKVSVLLAVGGWEYEDVVLEEVFMEAAATEEKRKHLAEEIVSVCEEYGFDGIDIDWEYPKQNREGMNPYEPLMLLLAEKLHSKGKLLTTAVISGLEGNTKSIRREAAFYPDTVLEVVDWINVMAYDGGDGELHSGYEFAIGCGDYWKYTRNMPGEKVVLGVPFYGRPGWILYKDIVAEIEEAWKKDRCTYQGTEVWYNGCDTIKAKAEYAKKELSGIMMWELTQDALGEESLLSIIGKTMK